MISWPCSRRVLFWLEPYEAKVSSTVLRGVGGSNAVRLPDELKNQWGWCGFVTQDLLRCQIAARNIALIYNWWSLFVRLADPSKKREAITSRPMLMGSVARETTHAGQVSLTITPTHGKALKIQEMLNTLSGFLHALMNSAEQLTSTERWRRILSKIFERQLRGRPLGEPAMALG